MAELGFAVEIANVRSDVGAECCFLKELIIYQIGKNFYAKNNLFHAKFFKHSFSRKRFFQANIFCEQDIFVKKTFT